MKTITIHHAATGDVLYRTNCGDIRTAVERAASDNADLSGADLRHANLSEAALDGANMRGARMDNANLARANLSEAALAGSVFAGAELQGACLCFSDLSRCDFSYAACGGADIAGARLDRSRFASFSALAMNFRDAGSLSGCIYDGASGHAVFSRPPVAINGLDWPVALLDRHILAGQTLIGLSEWMAGTSFAGCWPEGLKDFLTCMRGSLGRYAMMRIAAAAPDLAPAI